MRSLSVLAIVIGLIPLLGSFRTDSEAVVRVENNHFVYTIASDGRNLSFLDKKTGKNYLSSDSVSWCAGVTLGGREWLPSSVEQTSTGLTFAFKEVGVVGFVSWKSYETHVAFRVDSVVGAPDQFTFLNIPLALEAVPDEPFAACALSLNLPTHVRQLPALQDHLWASCYSKFGLEGAEAAVIAIQTDEMLAAIRTVMRGATDIPFSDKGGAWAQLNKEGYGSYLMDFGSLTLETVDDWIAKCDSLGFNQIAIHGANSFFMNGDMELYPSKWPGGWKDFKKINARLHEAGISSILLTYAYFIDKKSTLVSPVPSADLGYFSAFTLERPLGLNDSVVVVHESTAGVSPVTGYFIQNSRILRVGEELIEFTGVTDTPPYTFTGLKRGALGTRIQRHAVGEKSYHLQEMFGQFVAGPETALFDEIARKTARIINENDFDGLYLDAIDGNNMLGGKENAWYYGSKFVLEIARNLKPMVGMEMCDMPHHYWHYSSRWQAWDKAVRGYKRFVDVHMAALKSDDHRHGEWIGYTQSINRLAPVKFGRLMLPLHMGWWGNSTWDSPQVETTFPDDIEYLLCKMIGNDAGLSMLGGTDEKTLNEKPIFRKLVALTRRYERLRQDGYFSEKVKEELREPGREFTLTEEKGEPRLRAVLYDKYMATGNEWHRVVVNPYAEQPLKVRIQAQLSTESFSSSGNIDLAAPNLAREFRLDTVAAGVEAEMSIGTDPERNESVTVLKVKNNSARVQEATWVKWEKTFDPCLDLSKHQGLGVWVKGDGSGALLNLRTESPKHLSMGGRGDHFVVLDFKGWKYFELVEIESARFNDYLWPDEYHNVYNSYFYKVVFTCVDKLQIWVNNVPAGKEVEVHIGSIKALPLRKQTIENPAIEIGAKKLIFPVEMEAGMYLEFEHLDDCRLYTPEGKFLQKVKPVGAVPMLQSGENLVKFTHPSPGRLTSRAQLMLTLSGGLLEN